MQVWQEGRQAWWIESQPARHSAQTATACIHWLWEADMPYYGTSRDALELAWEFLAAVTLLRLLLPAAAAAAPAAGCCCHQVCPQSC